jgi:hypothetical protein
MSTNGHARRLGKLEDLALARLAECASRRYGLDARRILEGFRAAMAAGDDGDGLTRREYVEKLAAERGLDADRLLEMADQIRRDLEAEGWELGPWGP